MPTTTSTYLTWLRAHEKLLIEVVAGIMLWFSTNAVLKRWDAYQASKTNAAQQVVASDKATNASLESQIASLKAANAASAALYRSQLAAETAAIAQITKTVSQMPAPTVAHDLGGTAPDASTVVLPLDSAKIDLAAIQTLDLTKQELASTQNQLTSETSLETRQETLVEGLQKQLGDQDKACQAQVAQLKTEKKRAWLSGFKYGAIAGFVGGIITVKKVL